MTQKQQLVRSVHFPFVFGSNWNFWVLFKGIYNLGSLKQANHYLTICMCLCAQLYSSLCSPMDCSPPGSSVHGIFQARNLGWVAISFFRGSSWPRDGTWVSYNFLHWQTDSLPRKPNNLYAWSLMLSLPSLKYHQYYINNMELFSPELSSFLFS